MENTYPYWRRRREKNSPFKVKEVFLNVKTV